MQKEDIKISCSDGITLSATLYKPDAPKAAIMFAPATGIKRGFYNSLATYLAEQGYGSICFDNRGIGASKGKNLNKVNASLVNWGRLDMTAVLETLKSYFPNQKYHLIGHSAGGQLIGLMDNAMELTSVFNFASSSGSLRNMSYPFKLQASFFLNVFIPMSNLFLGKTNSQWMGMGEPLPKTVAKEWSKWCNGAGYIKVDLDKTIQNHCYNDLDLPSKWLHATDDGIANYENVQDMVRVFTKMKPEIVTLDPAKYNFKEIGHMMFFSSKKKELWHFALDWLEQHS